MRRSFQVTNYTPTATADTTNLANATYQALAAAASTSGLYVMEIYEGGQASASSINFMQWARDVVVASGGAALAAPNSDGPLNSFFNPITTAIGAVVAASTPPQRSAAITAARLNLSLNTFGGIVRWVAAPGEEWYILGTAVNVSESSLSAFTGGSAGALGSHVVYEAL